MSVMDHVDDYGQPIHPPPPERADMLEELLFDLVADLPNGLEDPTGSVAKARAYCLAVATAPKTPAVSP